jgi:hypothetical protein
MEKYSEVFVAFDVAKKKHGVAIAEGGRSGEVRFLGDVENNPLLSRGRSRGWPTDMAGSMSALKRSDGMRALSPDPGAWSRLHGRCACADPETGGRAGQDEPTGFGHVGAAASRR